MNKEEKEIIGANDTDEKKEEGATEAKKEEQKVEEKPKEAPKPVPKPKPVALQKQPAQALS